MLFSHSPPPPPSKTPQGLTPESLGRIFTPFNTVGEGKGPRRVPGAGLGLFISRQLCEAMGGGLSATSGGLRKGATFTFDLPLAVPLKPDGDADARRLLPLPHLRGRCAVVAVPWPPLQAAVCASLLSWGAALVTQADSGEALASILRSPDSTADVLIVARDDAGMRAALVAAAAFSARPLPPAIVLLAWPDAAPAEGEAAVASAAAAAAAAAAADIAALSASLAHAATYALVVRKPFSLARLHAAVAEAAAAPRAAPPAAAAAAAAHGAAALSPVSAEKRAPQRSASQPEPPRVASAAAPPPVAAPPPAAAAAPDAPPPAKRTSVLLVEDNKSNASACRLAPSRAPRHAPAPARVDAVLVAHRTHTFIHPTHVTHSLLAPCSPPLSSSTPSRHRAHARRVRLRGDQRVRRRAGAGADARRHARGARRL